MNYEKRITKTELLVMRFIFVQYNKIKKGDFLMLKNLVAVGIGGAIGAVLRYALALLLPNSSLLATFSVNIIGAFLLAYFLSYRALRHYPKNTVQLFFGTGVLGAFTTFSTLALEIVQALQDEKMFLALSYLSLSFFVGLGASLLGYYVAKRGIAL